MSKILLFGIIFLLGFSRLQSQEVYTLPPTAEIPYSVAKWTTSSGLPQNSINRVLQDLDGYLWVFTNEGTARFDGVKFEIFNAKNTPGLEGNRLEDAEISSDGIIWCSSSEGLIIRIDPKTKEFQSFRIKNYIDYQKGIDINDRNEPIIVLRDGFYMFNPSDTSLTPIATHAFIEKHPIRNFCFQSKSKTIYFSSPVGVYSISENNTIDTVQKQKPRDALLNVFSLNEEILGVSGHNYFRFYKGQQLIKEVNLHKIIPGSYVGFSAVEDQKGNLYLSSKSGVIRINANDTLILNDQQGLSSNFARSLFIDDKNNIWVGTDDYGLNQLTPNLFEKIELPASFKNMSVTAVEYAHDNTLWFIRSCNGAIQYNLKNHQLKHYKTLVNTDTNQPNRYSDCLSTVYEDSYGTIWLAGFGADLRKIQNGKVTIYNSDQYSIEQDNLCFRQISDNELLIGSSEGLFSFDYSTEKFSCWYDSINLPKLPYNFILKDSKNRIWLTSKHGIVVIEKGQFTWYNTENKSVPSNNFRYVYEDQRGNIWLGSYGNGLFFYEDNEFTQIPIEFPARSQAVSWIQEYDGKFWMTSNSGINAVATAKLYDVLKGNIDQVEAIHFGVENGLVNDEFNGGFQSSGELIDGKFYLPTIRGVVIFYPERTQNLFPQKPQFILADLDGEQVKIEEQLAIPYEFIRLELDVSVPTYNNRQNYALEYKLEGFDKKWMTLKDGNKVTFTKLPPGKYTLFLRNRSIIDDEFAVNSIELTVESPFWRKTTFIIVAISISLTLLLLFAYSYSERSKKREQALSRLIEEKTSELRKSKNNISSIIESTQDLVWSIDKKGNLIYANENYLNRFEATNKVKLSVGDNILKMAKPSKRKFWEPIFKRALAGEPYHMTLVRSEEALKNRDSFAVTELTMNPIHDDLTGEFLGIVGFSKDVTAFHIQQKELEEAKEEALAAAKSKAEFLATMSHEIRTPMNGVLGMTSLLIETPLTKEQRDYVDTIRISGDTLLSIINEILDFSKIDSGNLILEDFPIDIEELINDCFDLVRTKAHEKSLTLKYTIDYNVPICIYGDVTRLRQVLLNLINNAVKFTQKGYVFVKVSLAAETDQILFSVVDTGIGIEKAKLKHLFKPFNQLDSSTTRKFGGTGLGLAISKKLVELMGGEISAQSRDNQGSTFNFKLPYRSALLDENKKLNFSIFPNINIVFFDPDGITSSLIKTLDFYQINSLVASNAQEFSGFIQNSSALAYILVGTAPPQELESVFKVMNDIPDKGTILLIHGENNEELNKQLSVKADLDFYLNFDEATLVNKLYKTIHKKQFVEKEQRNLEKTAKELPLKILVAEDNLINQKLISMLLEKLGYVPDVVANGAEAVSSVNRQHYDLVLMDIQMPEMDGFQATQRIIELYDKERPFIIAMTANAMEGDKDLCLQNGMDDYVPKPITLDIVRDVIIKWGTKLHS